MSVLAEAVLPPQLEAFVAAMVDEDTRELARPKGLEAETTQNAYGYYLGVLSRVPAIDGLSSASSLMLWGVILARSGGNEAGIRSALRVMT